MLSAWFRSRAATPCWLTVSILLILAIIVTTAHTAAVQPGTERFQRTWARTDQPVLDGLVPRTWMWGPEANVDVMQEPYEEAPGGLRTVQYFDKARMEDNSYRADGPPWDVTNGLLVVELISGRLQTGDANFESRQPAMVNVAGDADDPSGPTYATFGSLLDAPARDLGATVTERVDRQADVSDDPALASNAVTIGYIDEVTAHAIAAPFWDFMNTTGMVYEDGQLITAFLFENPYFATGRPITEAYWANVKVAGTYRDVLMQCFERRCLTYTPGNPEGFVVEAGNVGQHYYSWRYPDGGNGTPTAEPTANATQTAEPSATAEPTATSQPTGTATPTATEEPSPTPALNYAYADQWGGPYDPETPFDQLAGIAFSPLGYVYVTEGGQKDRIQKYTTNGIYVTRWGKPGTGNGEFDLPQDVATDADGNVYVVDRTNNRIQKFDENGTYLTQWGTTGAGNGEFSSPVGIAISSSGNVYVTDSGNQRVQRFDTAGNYVGQFGSPGAGNGQFNYPRYIAVDASGNVYVSDADNNRVQKFDAAGIYLTQWGGAGTEDGKFMGPDGIDVDSAGNVYVVDYGNDRVQKFTSDGAFLIKWGGTGDQVDKFNSAIGLAVDAQDNVYVVDSLEKRVQKFDSDGDFLDLWRNGTRARFYSIPVGLAVDPDGNSFVGDGNRVQKFDASGAWVMDIVDPAVNILILEAASVALSPDGHLYVVDRDTSKIIKFTQAGAYVTTWGGDGTGNGQFDEPWGLAVDAQGSVYVADRNNNRIQKFTPDGVYITQWGAPGNRDGEFNHPDDIAIHGERVYVADESNYRIQVFDLDGAYIGQWGSFGSNPGQFDRPAGLAVDADGYVYVADTGNHRIQKFTPDGVYLTTIGAAGSGDGQLASPYNVEVDAAGNVIVLDTGNKRVQKFVPVP